MSNFYSLFLAALIAFLPCRPAMAQGSGSAGPNSRSQNWRDQNSRGQNLPGENMLDPRDQRRAMLRERHRLMNWPLGVEAVRNMPYVAGSHDPAHQLDLFIPPHPEKATLPLIIFIHGGGWSAGDKATEHNWIFLLNQGYAVAAINYRLSGEAIWPAQIYDCKAAVRWLRANAKKYSLNPDKFGVWGESAGGHLVAVLGITGGDKELEGSEGTLGASSKVQAVCDYYGPTDLVTLVDRPGNAPDANKEEARDFTEKFIGGKLAQHLAAAKLASPITYLNDNRSGSPLPPFLIVHGGGDSLVPPGQSRELYDALKAKHADVTLHIVAGAAHGGAAFNRFETKQMVWEFFDEKLKGAHPNKVASPHGGSVGQATAPALDPARVGAGSGYRID